MRPDNDSDDCEFRWCDDHGNDVDDVVIREQPPVACYTNPAGDVVLRQSRWPDEDDWVWFQPQHAGAICQAILDRAGLEPADVFPELRQPSRKAGSDPTAAERQRRRRDKDRDSDRDSAVTATVTGGTDG